MQLRKNLQFVIPKILYIKKNNYVSCLYQSLYLIILYIKVLKSSENEYYMRYFIIIQVKIALNKKI